MTEQAQTTEAKCPRCGSFNRTAPNVWAVHCEQCDQDFTLYADPDEPKCTPTPWRWGFWKRVGRSLTRVEFRPPNERDPDDDELILLGNVDYGQQTDRQNSVLTVLDSEAFNYGDNSTLVVKNAADMALIAAAPEVAAQRDELLALLEEFTGAMSQPCPDYYAMAQTACKANALIARTKGDGR